MAKSLSAAAARLIPSVPESAALLLSRRGYAASSEAVSRGVSKDEQSAMRRKRQIEGIADSPSSSWVPDPVTGYYRPGSGTADVDPAELREMFLSNRSRH